MEQSCKDRITDPDQSTDNRNGNADNDGIINQLFPGRPGYFFHFGDYFVYEFLHSYFTSPFKPQKRLFRLFVQRVFLAELAVLIELQTIRVVLFVLVGAVVAAMALRALQRDIVAHLLFTPLTLRNYDFFTMSLIQFSTLAVACQQGNLDKKKFIRTLYIKKTPFQGSIGQNWWRHRDLNSGHCGYEPHALAN